MQTEIGMWTEGGWFYGTFIDPLLSGIRKAMREMIDPPGAVIDIGCATGAFASSLAELSPRVVGVELLPRLVEYANRRHGGRCDGVSFILADASSLPQFNDGEFEYATLSMALHQMEPAIRRAVLAEAMRISRAVILADYAVPLPSGPAGWSARTVELLAGPPHFRGFCSFMREGGLDGLMAEARLSPRRECFAGAGVFRIVRCAEHRPSFQA